MGQIFPSVYGIQSWATEFTEWVQGTEGDKVMLASGMPNLLTLQHYVIIYKIMFENCTVKLQESS